MPRKPRQLTEAGLYHVICRGNNRQKLFFEPEDFKHYLALLFQMESIYNFDLYHYCLMTNHVHLLMRFYDAESLQKVMQRINLTYAKRYRRKCRYHGHVFQDRFKSFAVNEDSYLLECGRYIERNPLRAQLVEDLRNYPWSSYGYYACGEANTLVSENPLYSEMGNSPPERQQRYREYLLIERPYEELIEAGLMRN